MDGQSTSPAVQLIYQIPFVLRVALSNSAVRLRSGRGDRMRRKIARHVAGLVRPHGGSFVA